MVYIFFTILIFLSPYNIHGNLRYNVNTNYARLDEKRNAISLYYIKS